jgi:hypothetical protein
VSSAANVAGLGENQMHSAKANPADITTCFRVMCVFSFNQTAA